LIREQIAGEDPDAFFLCEKRPGRNFNF
jgi:hypothetical protein